MIWGMLGSLIAGVAAVFYFRKKAQNDYYAQEKPPKHAPQLDLNNPGSQHDFPKPPQPSEVG